MTTSVVPRIPRRRRPQIFAPARKSRMPLLLQLIWLRIRLRATLWRAEAGSLLLLCWLWCKLMALRLSRRVLDKVLPPRE